MDVIPWDNLEPTDLIGRVDAIGKHERIIDWGCGKNDSPISEQVKELECERLVSIDAWAENIMAVSESSARGEYKAKRHLMARDEVQRKVNGLMDGIMYDLSLCLDILEHMEAGEAIEWLAAVEGVSDRVLIWIPLGPTKDAMDHDWWGNNHHYNAHRADWTREDLKKLGYTCEVLEDFHTPMFGWRVDGCWAYKKCGVKG